METTERHGWREHWRSRLSMLAIAGIVIVHDMTCKKGDTITEETRRLRQTKLGQHVVPWLVDSVADHLLERVAPEDDWIHKVAELSPKD
jgi:hypothetical protein